jgi:bacterioferritin-associated ferredoxin
MIVCHCNVISDGDISRALLYLLNLPEAPIPTPGLVFRTLNHRFNCCSCAPVAVETIYAAMERLEKQGLICPYRSAATKKQLARMAERTGRRVGADETA